MKLFHKIFLVSSVASLGVGGAGIGGQLNTQNSTEKIFKLANELQLKSFKIQEIVSENEEIQDAVQKLMSETNPDLIESDLETITGKQINLRDKISLCAEDYGQMGSLYSQLVVMQKRLVESFLQGKGAESFQYLVTDVSPSFALISKESIKVLNENKKKFLESMEAGAKFSAQEQKTRFS